MRPLGLAYILICFSAIPLWAMLLAVIVSGGFINLETWTIPFAMTLGGGGLTETTRTALGSVIVPFFTAYAVQKIDAHQKLPRDVVALALLTLAILAVSVGLWGSYDLMFERGLQHVTETSSATREEFQKVPAQYAKEALAYLALLFGIHSSKGRQ